MVLQNFFLQKKHHFTIEVQHKPNENSIEVTLSALILN
jgi:hypothetical protein